MLTVIVAIAGAVHVPWAIVVPDGQRRLLCFATEERGRRNAINGTLLSAILET